MVNGFHTDAVALCHMLHPGPITPSSTGGPASNPRDDEVGGGGIIRGALLFADLMPVPLPEDRYPRLSMTAQQQRDATLDAIVAWLIEMAERTPVLMAWEDLHWA